MDGCDPQAQPPRVPRGSSVVIHPEVGRLRRERLTGSPLGLGQALLDLERAGTFDNLHTWGAARDHEEVRMASHGRPPAFLGGTALCLGVDEYQEQRFQFPRGGASPGWGAALSAQGAAEAMRAHGMVVRVLTGAMATQAAILATLRDLQAIHDPEAPFVLWLSGLALGHGARTRFLPWDSDWNHPLGRALDMTRLHAMLRTVPHWGLVLDTAWPHGEGARERLGLVHRLHPLEDLPQCEGAPAEVQRTRTALLVAMSGGSHPDVPGLPGARGEMGVLGDVLSGSMAFDDVRILENPSTATLLAEAQGLAAKAGTNGLFLFGFQGFGFRDMAEDQGILLCEGADPWERRSRHGKLAIHQLLLRTLAAGQRALLLDLRGGLPERLGAPSLSDMAINGLGALAGTPTSAFHNVGVVAVRNAGDTFGASLRDLMSQQEIPGFPRGLADALACACTDQEDSFQVDFAGFEVPAFAPPSGVWASGRPPIRVGRTPHADFPMLQAALDAAPPGAVIHVAPGHYRESLVISKPVTVIGVGAPGGVYLFPPEGEGLRVDAPGVHLADLILVEEDPPRATDTTPRALVRVGAGSLELDRCEIHAQSHVALQVINPGVMVNLRQCLLEGAKEAGVKAELGARVKMDGCTLGQAGRCGLELFCVSSAQVTDTRILGHRMTGILVGGGCKVDIEGGVILSNGDCGVVVVGEGEAFLSRCRFGDAARVGILLKGKARAQVRGCAFTTRVGHRPWQAEEGAQVHLEDNGLSGA